MNAIKLMEVLKKSSKAVFSIKDIARIINNNEKYASLSLLRLKKRGLIAEIEKGKYSLPDTSVAPISTALILPAYVSFNYALNFYKATTQIPQVIEIVGPKSKQKIAHQGYIIEFIKFDKKRIFGYKKEFIFGKTVFVVEPEKLILDCLFIRRTSTEDILTLLKKEKINFTKLYKYAKRMTSMIVIKRLGYLLEVTKNKAHKRFLKMKFSKKYEKLNTLLPVKGNRNSKWKLIINEDFNVRQTRA